MTRLRGDRFAPSRLARPAHRAGAQMLGEAPVRCVIAAFLAAASIAVLAITLAPMSVADSTADLQSEVDSARGPARRCDQTPCSLGGPARKR